MTRLSKILFTFTIIFTIIYCDCVHDHFAHNTTKHFYDDLTDARLLQNAEDGRYSIYKFRIRIFVDYTQVTVGGQTEVNIIKRVTNITATYFYNVLNVTRLDRLYFPSSESLKCIPNIILVSIHSYKIN